MKSYTVQIASATVRQLETIASMRVKMISVWPGSEYNPLSRNISMHIMMKVQIREMIRKRLVNFFVSSAVF